MTAGKPGRAPEAGPDGLAAVTIHTDGGADPNPGTGGWGAVLRDEASGARRELRGGEAHTTNNRMELTAAIRALEALDGRCRVRVVTDSLYLRRGVTEWLPGWILRGFRRQAGVLQNEDLWRRLSELVARHEVRWEWVKGHAGHRDNERADQLATEAIREQRAALAAESAPGQTAAPAAEVFLRVATSGSLGAWGALVRAGGTEWLLSGTQAGATANLLDLLAAVTVLESLPAGASAAVHTASDYLRHGAARWLAGWQRAGWRTAGGGAVKNRELWQRLAAAQAERRVSWPEVKGLDLPELERAAAAAREALRPAAPGPEGR